MQKLKVTSDKNSYEDLPEPASSPKVGSGAHASNPWAPCAKEQGHRQQQGTFSSKLVEYLWIHQKLHFTECPWRYLLVIPYLP